MNASLFGSARTRVHNDSLLAGTVTFGASGAVASQDCDLFVVTKVGTGAYRITLNEPVNSAVASLTWNDNGTTADSSVKRSGALTNSQTLDFKYFQGSTPAAADAPSGSSVDILIFVRIGIV